MRWLWILAVVVLSLITAGHALLAKRDPRAAMGWIVACLALPVAGPLLYFFFGINRIRTRAQTLKRRRRVLREGVPPALAVEDLAPEHAALARVSSAVTDLQLAGGNAVEPLYNGEQAYPAMLAAIDGAAARLYLATYIFEPNATGKAFVDALRRAQSRGVDVRVLVDGVGELYSRPRIGSLLAAAGVPFARYLPPRLLPPSLHMNLRNHRKVLVADGRLAFTGGMNLGDRHLAESGDPARVVDVHFRLAGPIVAQVERVFRDDWAFASGEPAPPPSEVPAVAGDAVCRAIVDGPDEDLDKLVTVLVGAVSAARRRVAIMNPYFLPPRELLGALQAAALRGVEVTVILPRQNNLPYVHWATRNLLWELLCRGVRIYYQPPPFVHSKLFVVDDCYVQVGSANLDPRSLRLNFELAVEVFDRPFAERLLAHFETVRHASTEVTLTEVDARSSAQRVRDALCWLFTPYM